MRIAKRFVVQDSRALLPNSARQFRMRYYQSFGAGSNHGEDQKGSDGRRLFSAEFKQEAVRRVTSGEITAAELTRELGIQPSLLQHRRRRITGVASIAVTANEDVVPNHPDAAMCRTLSIGRATPYRSTQGRPAQYAKADDPVVAAQIREICLLYTSPSPRDRQ